MYLPKNFLTWLMILLLVLLASLVGWMFWALGKAEGARRGKGKGVPVPAEVKDARGPTGS